MSAGDEQVLDRRPGPAFMAATVGVVGILSRREFHSDLLTVLTVLAVLADDAPVV